MKAILLNRAILALSYIGVFIAGTLSLSHAMKLVLPCGVSDGCEKVNNSVYAQWAGIPVAYFGLIGYVLLAILATLRISAPEDRSRKLTSAGWGVSIVGVAASAYLTYVAMTLIRATCVWCLASAAVMILLFVAHTLLWQNDEVPRATSGRTDFGLMIGLPVLALIGVAGSAVALQSKASGVGSLNANSKSEAILARLLAEPNHSKGPKDAPITIIEFADFFCPACRESFPQLQALVDASPGLRLIYRHYPLYQKEGHSTSLLAAQLSEIAAEKGKFWDFAKLLIAADLTTVADKPEPLLAIMEQIGFETKSFSKRVGKEDEKTFQQVYADLELANDAGLQITPSFYIIGKGMEPKIVGFNDLAKTLQEPAYQKLLNPASGDGPPTPVDAK